MKNSTLTNILASSVIGLGALFGTTAFAEDSSDVNPSSGQTTSPNSDGTTGTSDGSGSGTQSSPQGGNGGY